MGLKHLTVDDLGISIAKQQSNVVTINSLSDFPTPVAGVITLVAGTKYIVTVAINIGTDHLLLADNTSICGISPFISAITYTGTGGAIRGTDVSFLLHNLSITAATATAEAVVLTNNTKTKSFVINFCVFNGCDKAGTITGFFDAVLTFNQFTSNLDGLTITSSKHLYFENNKIHSSNTGTFLDIPSGTFDIIIIVMNYIDVPLASTGIAIDYALVTINEFTNLITNLLEGAGTLTTGFTSYDLKIHSSSNIGIDDSVALGSMYWKGNIGIMTNAGVAAKITGGTSIAGVLQRFTHTSPNKLTYIGLENISFNVNVGLAAYYSTGGVFIAEISVAKNGVVIASSINAFTIYTADEPSSTNTEVTLVTNDFIEVFIKDVTGGSGNFIISYLNVQIQGK